MQATRFYAPAHEAGVLKDYLKALRHLLVGAIALIVVPSAFLCLCLALTGQSMWVGLGVSAVCFAIFSGFNSLLSGIQNAARQRIVVAIHQGLASWGRFFLAAVMVVCLGDTSTVAMVGYAFAILIVLASQFFFFPTNSTAIRAQFKFGIRCL